MLTSWCQVPPPPAGRRREATIHSVCHWLQKERKKKEDSPLPNREAEVGVVAPAVFYARSLAYGHLGSINHRYLLRMLLACLLAQVGCLT